MKFETCITYILKYEGGYVFDPKDPGGETNHGISKRSFPNLDIKNLTRMQAAQIYKEHYWDKINCESLAPHLRLMALDCAINQGPTFCEKCILELASTKEYSELNEFNSVKILQKFFILRLERYLTNKNFSIFGRGWINRLIDILKLSPTHTDSTFVHHYN